MLVCQSDLTLYGPYGLYSLRGSSVHGILQARILEWVAISFSRGSSWCRDWTRVSRVAGRFVTIWATGKLHYGISVLIKRELRELAASLLLCAIWRYNEKMVICKPWIGPSARTWPWWQPNFRLPASGTDIFCLSWSPSSKKEKTPIYL